MDTKRFFGDSVVVGTFLTYEQAQRAARHLDYIVRQIALILRDLSPEQNKAWRSQLEPNPIERWLGSQYGGTWYLNDDGKPAHFDWIVRNPAIATQAITLFEKNVFVGDIENDVVDIDPFISLLSAWGASVVSAQQFYEQLMGVTLSCLAPDEGTAEKLLADVKPFLRTTFPNAKIRYLKIADIFYAQDKVNIARDGLKLIYPLDEFDNIRRDFPAFINYLLEHGCTEIEYIFFQTAYETE